MRMDELNKQAMCCLEQGHLQEAESLFKHMLEIEPSANAYSNLGSVLGRMGKHSEARDCFERALFLQSDFAPAYRNLGVALKNLGKSAEAAAALKRATELDVSDAGAYRLLGTICGENGLIDEALENLHRSLTLEPESFESHRTVGILLVLLRLLGPAECALRRALNLNPEDIELSMVLAVVLLTKGHYPEGWTCYEARLRKDGYFPRFASTLPEWKGEPLAGKSLLVWLEQGMGDTIQFCRYIASLKKLGATRVAIYGATQRALKLLLMNMDGVDAFVESFEALDTTAFDYWVACMSLPARFETTLSTIPAHLPYIKTPNDLVEKWDKQLALPPCVLKVGIVWAGGSRPEQPDCSLTDRRRSIHLTTFLPVLQVPGVVFVSLQKGEAAQAQLREIPTHLRPVDPMDDVNDFADTAAIIENLDLVIAVDTATAHLAAALGRTVWLLSRFDGCWRWLENRDDSPWYPKVLRLYRQPSPWDWQTPIEEIRLALLRQRDSFFCRV
jgi:tetratricopeptide (TPR) repeat protein